MRARIILRAAEGAAHVQIADELGVSVPTVLLWRRRFKERGLAGLGDAPHPGRPRTYGREVREQILASHPDAARGDDPLEPGPARQAGRRVRLDRRPGVGGGPAQAAPGRDVQVQPGPELVAKITDVVGLYLAPPERAIVLSVDEKTQIQALDRTQPMLPLQARAGGAPHPRLQAQRHAQPVRGARGRDRAGDAPGPRAAHR